MKSNDTYLCPDCDEVFSFIEPQNIIYIHYPICPICGNKSVLNIGRVLNRKEEKKDEGATRRVDSGGYVGGPLPTGRLDVDGPASDVKSVPDGEIRFVEGSGNQSGDRRSGGEDRRSDSNSEQTDKAVGVVSALFDVFGILVQQKRRIEQELSRVNANTSKGAL